MDLNVLWFILFTVLFVGFFFLEGVEIYKFAGQKIGIARVFHAYAFQHLPNDDFDVFIVDIHALRTVYGLYLFKDIVPHARNAFNAQNILRINAAEVKKIAGLHFIAVFHFQFRVERQYVLFQLLARVFVFHEHVFQIVRRIDSNDARNLA